MIRLLPREPLETLKGQAAMEIGDALDLAPAVAELLVRRGVDTVDKARDFLNPTAEGLHDPFLLDGMTEAVERISAAIDAGERIMLYGDYDVDGVSGTAMLLMALRRHGASVDYYIPSRHTEGYGLNEDAVGAIAGQGASLMITVDCGISNRQEVNRALELHMDVIVTDHHQCPELLPECTAVVNPHKAGQAYPFDSLCGAGVAFKLVEAIFGREEALRYADLAALATVADIVPLLGENRILTKLGLDAINENPRLGIRALLEAAALERQTIGAGHLGFQLGPRINAGGRLDLARKGVELLTADDEQTAAALASELDGDNARRKSICARMEEEAAGMVLDEVDFFRDRAIVLWRDDWNSGVLGIVASKLVERYYRPVVLLSREEERYHGSARSIPGVDLYRVLTGCGDLFLRFGGHEQAAGMAMTADHLSEFRERFNELLRSNIDEDVFVPSRFYDRMMDIGDIDSRLMANLDQLKPTGFGNARPVFLLPEVRMGAIRTMGAEGRHYRTSVIGGRQSLNLVAFGQQPPLMAAARHDILIYPEENEWQGAKTLQGNILSVRTRSTADDVLSLIGEIEDAFTLSLWQQFLGEECQDGGEDIPVHEAEDYCQKLASAGGFQGVLLLLPEKRTAAEAVDMLARHELLDRFEVRAGDDLHGTPGDNCLALAPDFTRVNPRFWSEIGIWGGILCKEFERNHLSRLSRDKIGIIMEHKHRAYARESLSQSGMGDDLLRRIYVVVRQGMQQGKTFREEKGPSLWLAQQMGIPAAVAAAGLRILGELSLVRCTRRAPYLIFNDNPGKVALEDSATYRRIMQTLR